MDEDKVRDLMDCFYKENSRRIVFADMIPTLLVEYDQEFEKRTSLTKIDWCFLFVAIGLQLVRQYCFTSFPTRKDDQSAAKDVKGDSKEHSNRRHRYYNPSLEEIKTNPVPFDANVGSHGALKGGGRHGHRGATLGHDPLLGLVFGTANIATSTLTNKRFESFHIKTGCLKNGRVQDVFAEKADTVKVINRTVDKILNEGQEGVEKVARSLVKEVVHLCSDVQSKNSLPLPVVTVFSSELSSYLAEHGVDWGNTCIITKQAAYATLINVVISMLHSIYGYIDKEDPKLFKVRTARILEYSNAIASIINLSVVAFTRDLKKLDIGGIAVAIFTIIKSEKFIRSVKEDFITRKIVEMAKMLKDGEKGIGLETQPANALGSTAISKVLDSEFNQNVCKIGEIVGQEYRQDRDAVDRIRHEAYGDRMVFHCPRGWTRKFWREKFTEYCAEVDVSKSLKEIALDYFVDIENEIQKYDAGDKFDVRQISVIHRILDLSPEARLNENPRDLEMTIEFLDILDVKRVDGANVDDIGTAVLEWLGQRRIEIQAALGEVEGANILVLGRHGSGKSTIVNALLGKNVCDIHQMDSAGWLNRLLAKVGVCGESPTGQRDQVLSRHTCVVNQVPISVYDTVGIENAKRDDWIEILEQERERRNCRTKLADWFHVVVYCIDAASARVEEVDVRAITGMIADGNAVRVLLTKADLVPEDKICTLRMDVLQRCPCLEGDYIVSVFNGDCKQGLKKVVYDSYVRTASELLPKRCQYLMKSHLTKFINDAEQYIDENYDFCKCMFGAKNFETLNEMCKAFETSFKNEYVPKEILSRELNVCGSIGRDLLQAMRFDFSTLRGDVHFFEDTDTWYEKICKGAFLAVSIVPIFVYSAPNAKEDEHKKLLDSLKTFEQGMNKQIDGFVDKLRQRISVVLMDVSDR